MYNVYLFVQKLKKIHFAMSTGDISHAALCTLASRTVQCPYITVRRRGEKKNMGEVVKESPGMHALHEYIIANVIPHAAFSIMRRKPSAVLFTLSLSPVEFCCCRVCCCYFSAPRDVCVFFSLSLDSITLPSWPKNLFKGT